MRAIKSFGRRCRHGYEWAISTLERTIVVAENRYTPISNFRPDQLTNWSFLKVPAAIGFLAMTLIAIGGSFYDSPFKLNMMHTWFFGQPSSTSQAATPLTLMFSVAFTFGGMFLFMRMWLRLSEVVKYHAGAPEKILRRILWLWAIPMIVAPIMFSRDVFSYAAQGEMTSYHVSPYTNGPWSLSPPGTNSFVNPVDPLWGNTPAPYGPFFLWLDSLIVRITGHHELASVVGLRLLEMLAVFIMSFAVPGIARSLGRDGGEALVFGVMNPLVLLTLIGGAHNDAMMVALLCLGIWWALRDHRIAGIVACTLAAMIKAPALLGVVYIAWTWRGPLASYRERIKPLAIGAVASLIPIFITTWLAGFGFGWVKNLATPGTVVNWAAPATGLAILIRNIGHWFGATVPFKGILAVTRAVGMISAISIALALFFTADKRGWVRNLGLTFVAFVLLGPVIQPWYMTWGVALVGCTYVKREHFWVMSLVIVTPFIDMPGGRQLMSGLVKASAPVMLITLLCLVAAILAPLGRCTQWSWPPHRILSADEQALLDARA